MGYSKQISRLGAGTALCVASAVLAGAAAMAQDSIRTYGSETGIFGLTPGSSFVAAGQTFRLDGPRDLVGVSLNVGNAGPYLIEVRRWNGLGVSTGPALYTTTPVPATGRQTIDLGSVSLDAAGEYIIVAVALSGHLSMSTDNSGFYTDGDAYSRGTGSSDIFGTSFGGTVDLAFILFFAPLGPTTSEELAALLGAGGTSGRMIVVGADGVARDAGQVSIATRNGQTTFTRVADGTGSGDVTMSTSGAPGMMGNLYTWAEITGFRSTTFGSGDGTLGGTGLQIGADIALGPDMVAGLSLGYSQVNSEDNGFTTEGTFTYLQPYFAYRSGAWSGNASLIYGMGAFEQSSAGGDGTADVTLAAVTFEGGYDLALAEGYTLTPTIGLIHGREEVSGTGGTLAGTSDEVTFSQASLGGRLAYDGPGGSLFAGLHLDYLTQETGSVLAADLLADEGWTGRVELGGETALGNGMELSTSVELSGLGGDMQTVSGGLRVALRF